MQGVNFNDVVVDESSVRSDTGGFCTVSKNHFDICKPTTMEDRSFTIFAAFVQLCVVQKGSKVTVRQTGALVDTPSLDQEGSKETVSQKVAPGDTPSLRPMNTYFLQKQK